MSQSRRLWEGDYGKEISFQAQAVIERFMSQFPHPHDSNQFSIETFIKKLALELQKI